MRETLEETGWRIELSGILGIALYTAPGNRHHLSTAPLFWASRCTAQGENALDPDIHAVHWLDYEEILRNSARMRSPLVLAS